MADELTPVTVETPSVLDLETTEEFKTWKQAKLKETLDYLQNNWKMDITLDKLVMVPEFTFPDRENRKAYASVNSGQSFRDDKRAIVVNPATGIPMTYTIWRKVDPPAETVLSEELESNIESDTITDTE